MIIGIDVSNMAYKEHHGRGSETAETIVNKSLAMLRSNAGSHVYLCYDSPGQTFRHRLFDQYKGKRTQDEHKAIVRRAIEATKPMAHNVGLHVLEDPDHEADDLLASLARQGRSRDEPVVLVSSDKDLYPLLIYRGVRLYRSVRSIGRDHAVGLLVQPDGEVTPQAIWDKYKVEPFQWTDFRCMVGDPSDNIDGLAGYGPQKSRMILDAFSTLDAMYGDWEMNRTGFSAKDMEKFDKFRERLPTLRRLYTLIDDLPVLKHQRQK